MDAKWWLEESKHRQSAVLAQSSSIHDTSSGPEVQRVIRKEYKKKTSHGIHDHGVEASDDLPGLGVKATDNLPKLGVCGIDMNEKIQTKTRRCAAKKWCVYLLLLTQMCCKVHGGVVKDSVDSCYDSDAEGRQIRDTDIETVCHIPHLTSSRCDTTADATCPTSDFNFDLLANMHCKYSCKMGEDVVCLNSDKGMYFVCLPQDISCPEGLGWTVSFNESSGHVEITVGKCQVGHYQETPSKCYNACKEKHIPLGHIPDGFEIYRKGDSSHPQLLMCDYNEGYYNPEKKNFLKADSQVQFNMAGFCVDSPNPCSDGQMPLHNGTCVDHCQDGYERNAPDFICKQMNDKKNGSIFTPTLPHVLTTPVPYDPPYDVSNSKIEASTDKTEIIVPDIANEKTTFEMFLPYFIGLFIAIGAAVVGIVIFLAVYLYRRSKKERNESYPGYRYHVPSAENPGRRLDSSQDGSANINETDVANQGRPESSSNGTVPHIEPHLQDQNRHNGSVVPRKMKKKTEIGNTNLHFGDGATVTIYNDPKSTVRDVSSSSDETLCKSVKSDCSPFDGIEENGDISGAIAKHCR